MLEIEFLGTGTSSGVPELQCNCNVCQSADWHDKRMRTSAIVRYQGSNLLIDCGPDFRSQMLRATSRKLDAVLLTHIHYDHTGGIEDLRAYCANERPFPIYAQQQVIDALHNRMPYCFQKPMPHLWIPAYDTHIVDENHDFSINGITIAPINVMHYKLHILGYRIGPLAYITDCKTIADSEITKIKGVDLLVINALRFTPHVSHMDLEQALAVINKIQPKEAYLTHMSHRLGLYAETSKLLPPHVHLAYDGLVLHTK